MKTSASFLKHNGQFDAQFDEGKFARALGSKTGIFCVVSETPAFFFIESNDEIVNEDGVVPVRTLQVSKKTMQLAGRNAKRGGKFAIVEF